MDEKTAQLRDIFRDVADTETVTESQSANRGSLADEDALRAGIREVIDRIAENEGLSVELAPGVIVDVVLDYYDGKTDDTIAGDLEVDPETVRRARLECHLLRESDLEAAVDVDRLRELSEQGRSTEDVADRLDADPDTVERVAEAIEARAAMNRTGRRYPDAFESAVAEAGLIDRLTADAKRDGLEEATADAEVDTDF